jgi:hypothetical protein
MSLRPQHALYRRPYDWHCESTGGPLTMPWAIRMYEFGQDVFDVRATDLALVDCPTDIGANNLLSWPGDGAGQTPPIGRGVDG